MANAQLDPVRLFKALSDETRLRILRLLDGRELSVNDITEILQSTQSRTSRHLNALKEAGLLDWRREGTWSFYRRPDEREISPEVQQVWSLAREWGAHAAGAREDQRRLKAALRRKRLRSQRFFGEHAGQWDELRERICGEIVTYQSLESLIPPTLTVADVGTGTGHFLLALARLVKKAIGVDNSREMLELAKRNAREEGFDNVELRFGEMEALPFQDEEVDAVFAGLVLHHAPDPGAAIAEMARIAKPGGAVTVIDLQRHNEEWMREDLAHAWLGFEESDVRRWFERAKLREIRWVEGAATVNGEKNAPRMRIKSFICYGRKK